MNNLKLKQQWKEFINDHYDLHFTIDLGLKHHETKRLTKTFLKHLHRKYKEQVFKSLIFIIDHGNSRIYSSHAHCLIKCNPNYPKLYEIIKLSDANEGIFMELFNVFRAWKLLHNMPRASIEISCNKSVLKNLGIESYWDGCTDCRTKDRNLGKIHKAKNEIEKQNNIKLAVVDDPCLKCGRKEFWKGWTNKEIIKYIFEKHNFNVNDHHFDHEHDIDFYKWHFGF
jgi:hypothetical protein